MESFRILPYLHQYVKTNSLTEYFIYFLIFLIVLKFTPLRNFLDKTSSGPKNKWLFLGALFVLAITLRLFWLGIAPYRPAFEWKDGPEKNYILTEYDGINISAKSLTEGVWFRDEFGAPLARRPIGYPMLLGLSYFLFGSQLWVVYALDMILILATIAFIYLLAEQMFGARAAAFAAAIFAAYPFSIYSISLPMDELLFMPLWYLGLYLLFREIQGKPVRWALLTYGLIFGYTTITRTQTIFMPLVVGYTYFLLKKPLGKKIASVLVVGGISFMLTLPWVARNYKHFDAFIPYAAPSIEFYPFNNPSVTRGEEASWPKEGQEGYEASQVLRKAKVAGDLKAMQSLSRKEILGWIAKHPVDFLTAGTERILFLFSADRSRGVWAIDNIQESAQNKPEMKLKESVEVPAEELAFAAYYIVLYSFLFGVYFVIKGWKLKTRTEKISILTITACFLFYIGEQLIVFPQRRYRYPLEPFMMMVAGVWLSWLLYDFRPKWSFARKSASR